METRDEVLRSLGRIEGRLDHIEKLLEKLAEPVRQLEMWQNWLKGVARHWQAASPTFSGKSRESEVFLFMVSGERALAASKAASSVVAKSLEGLS
jgi:hypothetical protein